MTSKRSKKEDLSTSSRTSPLGPILDGAKIPGVPGRAAESQVPYWHSKIAAECTLSVLRYLIPYSCDGKSCKNDYFLGWPPNLFAFTSMLLENTGRYSVVTDLKLWPPELDSDWEKTIKEEARHWVLQLTEYGNKSDGMFSFLDSDRVDLWEKAASLVPTKVRDAYDVIYAAALPEGEGTHDDYGKGDAKHDKLTQLLLTLHAIADTVCLGWGIREFTESEGQAKAAAIKAKELLEKWGTMATIHPHRARVLPKRHTSQVGITLQSLSYHLSFHRSSTKIEWITEGPQIVPRTLNTSAVGILSVLLCPWPRAISARDFKPMMLPQRDDKSKDGIFSYEPLSDPIGTRRLIEDVLAEAKKETETVHMVILPELALDLDELTEFESALRNHRVSSYVVGVRIPPNKTGKHTKDRSKQGRNFARFGYALKPGSRFLRTDQDKHHRWRLSEWQIRSYQLGSQLHPNYNWWEKLSVLERKLTFINLGDELTVCPLICEDLARQGPVLDLIRAVGPNLVVAILMDGPQRLDRWSARYATVLGDDPGCSVITLTSFGMVDRYSVPNSPRSRSIALWNDRVGPTREIELKPGADAVLMSLAVAPVMEGTIDRRTDSKGTYTLTLSGVVPISTQKITK